MPREKVKKTDLTVVPRFVSPVGDECPVCSGTGMELVEGGARLCVCRKRRLQERQTDSVNLPPRYDGFNFQNYRPANEKQKVALEYARNLTMNYPAVDRGLLLMGTVGVGKTHLAVSILKGLDERGFKCLFYDFASLLKEIQGSYNPNTQTSELSVLTPVLRSDVLVLDELGASKPTDWVRDTMTYIINTRYNDKRLTVFTTNYLDERRGEEELLEDRIGKRLRSRLYEMCKAVVIEGRDYRKTRDRQNAVGTV